MAFQKKVEQVYILRGGEKYLSSKRNSLKCFWHKNIVIDIYEYSVKIIFQNSHYEIQWVFLKAVKCLFRYNVEY